VVFQVVFEHPDLGGRGGGRGGGEAQQQQV
jgi:hypothetical protein